MQILIVTILSVILIYQYVTIRKLRWKKRCLLKGEATLNRRYIKETNQLKHELEGLRKKREKMQAYIENQKRYIRELKGYTLRDSSL